MGNLENRVNLSEPQGTDFFSYQEVRNGANQAFVTIFEHQGEVGLSLTEAPPVFKGLMGRVAAEAADRMAGLVGDEVALNPVAKIIADTHEGTITIGELNGAELRAGVNPFEGSASAMVQQCWQNVCAAAGAKIENSGPNRFSAAGTLHIKF